MELPFTETGADRFSMEKSFGKITRKPVCELKKDSAIHVLLRGFQNFSGQLFFRNTIEQLLPKIERAFFETPMDAN